MDKSYLPHFTRYLPFCWQNIKWENVSWNIPPYACVLWPQTMLFTWREILTAHCCWAIKYVSATSLLQNMTNLDTPNSSASAVYATILTGDQPLCVKTVWEQHIFTFCWAKNGKPVMPARLVTLQDRRLCLHTKHRNRHTTLEHLPGERTKMKQVDLTLLILAYFNDCTVEVKERMSYLIPVIVIDVITYPCWNNGYSM